MATGHWAYRRVLKERDNGTPYWATEKYWVADAPTAGAAAGAAAAAAAVAAAQRALAKKKEAEALAAAKKLAQKKAQERIAAEIAKSKANAQKLAQQQMAANKSAAYASLMEKNRATMLRLRKMGEAPDPIKSAPASSASTPAALMNAAKQNAANDAAERGWKSQHQQAAIAAQNQYAAQQAAAKAKEDAYQKKKARLLNDQQVPIAPGVPVYKTVKATIATPQDAKDAEEVMAEEAKRAGSSGADPKALADLQARYNAYAKTVADTYTKGVTDIDKYIYLLTGKAPRSQIKENGWKRPKNPTYAQKVAWYNKAKAAYGALTAKGGPQAEFFRMFGQDGKPHAPGEVKKYKDPKTGKTVTVPVTQGAYVTFNQNLDQAGLATRDWWKKQTQAALNSRAIELTQQIRGMRGMGENDPQIQQELDYVRKQQAIYNEDPAALGTTIDHYETRFVNGERRTVPVYRQKTVQEALDDQQAQLIASEKVARDQMIASQQTRMLRDRNLIKAEGLAAINAQGQPATPADWQSGNYKLQDAAQLRMVSQISKWAQEIYGVTDLADLPHVKRQQDLQDQADKFMGKWEEKYPQPVHEPGDVERGYQAKLTNPALASFTDDDAGYFVRLQAWENQRKIFEDQLYNFFGSQTPGALERLVTLPGVSHAFAILQGGVGAIGTGGRILLKATTGQSQIDSGINVSDLPKDVQDKVNAALKERLGTNDFWTNSNMAAAGAGGANGPMAGAAVINNNAAIIVNEWLHTDEGVQWLKGWDAKKAKEAAARHEEDMQFYNDFYNNNNQGLGGFFENIATSLDAMNKYGATPTTNDLANLAFQLLADPTNAIPLKFTTWAARFRYASKLAETTSSASKFALKDLVVKPWKFAVHWTAVEEPILKQMKELDSFTAELKRVGVSMEEVKQTLRETLAGVKDPRMVEDAINESLRKWGINPAKVETSQIQNIIEYAITQDIKDQGVDIFTHHKKVEAELKARELEVKRAKAAHEAEVKAARAKTEAEAAAKRAEGAKARGELATEYEAEAAATRKAAEEARAAAERAKMEADAPTPHPEPSAGAAAGAAREERPPAPPAAAAPATPPRATPKSPTEPGHAIAPLNRAIKHVFERVREMPERVRSGVSTSHYEAWQEFYEVRDGVIIPKAPRGKHDPNGLWLGTLRDKYLRSNEWQDLAKRARKDTPDGMEARKALAHKASLMRNEFRTAIEDMPSAAESKWAPSMYDLAERAAISTDEEAQTLLRKVRSIARHMQRQAARGNYEDVSAYQVATGLEDAPGRINTSLTRDTEKLSERAPGQPQIVAPQSVGHHEIVKAEVDTALSDGIDVEATTDYLMLGDAVIEAAKMTGRSLHEIFSSFTHYSLRMYERYADQAGIFKRLRTDKFVVEEFTTDQFAKLIKSMSGNPGPASTGHHLFGDGLTGWRDGGFAMFEVFHQLRLAAAKGGERGTLAMKKLEEFSQMVDQMLDMSVVSHGERYPLYEDNVFLWQWKVMENRVGLPWAQPIDIVAERFRVAAVDWGLHPDLALSQIPNGYRAAQPPYTFGLSGALEHLATQGRFVLAPANWTQREAVKMASDIITKGIGNPTQVIHYVAERFGDFIKGTPVTNRIMDELTHRLITKDMDVESLVEALTSHFREGTQLWEAYQRHLGMAADVMKQFEFKVDIEALDAAKLANPDLNEADWISKQRAAFERGNVMEPKDFLRSKIQEALKRNAAMKTDPKTAWKGVEYEQIRDMIFHAYWAGDLKVTDVAVHDLMYMMRLQTPGWGEAVISYMEVYGKYMTELGQTDHMLEFLKALHPARIEAQRGRFISERLSGVMGMKDPISNEVVGGSRGYEYDVMRKLGLLDWAEEDLTRQTKEMDAIHSSYVDPVEAEADNLDFIAHERDKPTDAYTGALTNDGIEANISRILAMEDDADAQVEALSHIVARMSDGSGARMAADEEATLERLWTGLTRQKNGAEVMRRVAEEGHATAFAARTPSRAELLAYKQAAIMIEISKIKRVGAHWEKRLEMLHEELAQIERLKGGLGEAKPEPGTIHGLKIVKTDHIPTTRRSVVAARYVPHQILSGGHEVAAHVLLNEDALAKKFAEKAWATPKLLADGTKVRAIPRNFFRNIEQFRTFVLEHEALHHTVKIMDGETRGAYETRINDLALKLLHSDPPAVRQDMIRELRAMEGPTGAVLPGKKRAHTMLQKQLEAFTEVFPETRPDASAEFARMRDEMLAAASTSEAELADAQRAVAGGGRPQLPPTDIPLIHQPSQSERAAVDASAMWLEKLMGMSEHDYWALVKERAHKVLIDPTASESAKAEARARITRVELAEYAEKADRARGTYVDWKMRANFRKGVIKSYAERAAAVFSPKLIAPYARDGYGAMVEQTRTWRSQLLRLPEEEARGVGSLGRGRAEDYFPVHLFEQVEPEVAKEIRMARGWAADTRTQARRGRGTRPKLDPEDELGPMAPTMRDTDKAVFQAKKRVLDKYGISVAAYDEARKVLWRGYVQHKTNMWLIKRTDDIVGRLAKSGKDVDWDETFLKLRAAEAKREAERQLGGMAFGELYGVTPESIIAEFEKRYSLSGDLAEVKVAPHSRFQRRTLEEAINARSMGRDIGVVLQSANRPPFEQGREAVRDWLVRHGQWSPRTAKDFMLGKKSWSVIEEARYWNEMFGVVPDWVNVEKLGVEFKDIFHNIELYYAQMRSWGIFNKSAELQLRLDGMSAKALEEAHYKGDPVLGIPERRSFEEQRRYAIERYGDLVSEIGPDGQRRLTAMPWLMTPEEQIHYFASRAANGVAEGLVQDTNALHELTALIEREIQPEVDNLLSAKAAGEQVTEEEIFRISSKVMQTIMSDPVWAKRWRDRLLGDPLNMWAKINRWLVFSNPAFLVMNVIDVPIKTAWYRATRQGLFRPGMHGYAADAIRRAQELTPAHLGMDAQSTIYDLRNRKAVDYFRNPRKTIRIGPATLDEARGVGMPFIRFIEYTEGIFHAIPEYAGYAELAGKMNLARGMYPQVYSEALARLGDAELADLWAKNFIKKEIGRMWPTVGDGPLEKLFNKLVPFSSYSVRNKILFISEVLAHPIVINRIEFIGRYLEQVNMADWEKDHPGEEMPAYLRRRIKLPWTKDENGDYMYLDLSAFSDASRGIKPLYGSTAPAKDQIAQWVRLINPGAQAAIYMFTNAIGLTKRTMYRPVLDENGYPTGRYTVETTGWTEPWSDKQPEAGSVFWLIDAVNSGMKLGSDGWTVRDITQFAGQTMMFNAITGYDRGTAYNSYYRALLAKDPAAAKLWLTTTTQGAYLKDWLLTKASSPREVMDALRDLSKLDSPDWFKLSAAEQKAIKDARLEIKAIRSVYAVKLAGMEYGTPEYTATKARMYYDINNVYLSTPELLKEEVWSKTPEQWSQQLQDWQTDKLMDDYMALSNKRPQRLDYKTRAAYEKAVEDWKTAKTTFLTNYPQVADALHGSIVAMDAARQSQNAEWDKILGQIDERNGMIEAARATVDKYGYDTKKGADAAEVANLLSIANGLDYDLLNKDNVAQYFQYEDFTHLGYKQQGPLQLGPGVVIKRTQILPDFGQSRWNKAVREGTTDAFIAQQEYGKEMREAIDYAKGGDSFGKFDGRKWYSYLKSHPAFREKYFAHDSTAEKKFTDSVRYVTEINAAIAAAKVGGKFDPAKFVAYVKSHPWLQEAYFKRHAGKREQWEKTDAYIKHISVWGKLMQAKQWDRAKTVWDHMPQWVKDEYYKKHPDRAKRAAQTAEYLGYMKHWVGLFDSAPKGEAMKYFQSLPKWVRDRYYQSHPDKRMKWETDSKMWTKVQSYFASDGAQAQADYLKANPDLARWLKQYGGGKAGQTAAILAAYASIPSGEQWLRKVFREKYPDVFSPEAAGKKKLAAIWKILQNHPEMQAGFDKWVAATWASYAEMMAQAKKRPASTYIQMDRKVPGRAQKQSLSAAESSLLQKRAAILRHPLGS